MVIDMMAQQKNPVTMSAWSEGLLPHFSATDMERYFFLFHKLSAGLHSMEWSGLSPPPCTCLQPRKRFGWNYYNNEFLKEERGEPPVYTQIDHQTLLR